MELGRFCTAVIQDPTVLFKIAKNPSSEIPIKQRMNLVCDVIGLVRHFKKEYREYVHNHGFRAMRPLIHYDKVRFARSFMTIKDFCISQSPLKTLIALLIDRNLHVYDYMHGRILFQLNVSSNMEPESFEAYKRSVFFTEGDQIVVVRSGHRRLTLVSVAHEMENYEKRQKIVKKDDFITLPGLKELGNIDIGFKRLVVAKTAEDIDSDESGADKNAEDSDGIGDD